MEIRFEVFTTVEIHTVVFSVIIEINPEVSSEDGSRMLPQNVVTCLPVCSAVS
jgi:hypothetical protein